ncbi:MAG: tripartite tricarboxylate transporter TctB family protein [Armatimonadota bacterium]|nr:tripartite tricarboxylate transporter TctB family protein [Armatimonadota bacterium]MDR7451218.1 tripartite tricarboxylate transporter TctB family protein [Armatimonadota bacterium]MDR7467177.1 tripartite tricarboxylate transporter TctB family protein [Armatimonadota bacterium]MDR7495190.1 tripartite tricarboxylate transporter TctB family protein [Armatimonadota bacterium]MDR7500099.1 tripartite tricarboxylate transporter TctB family protein [Armatimonadota bacterium]
MVEQARRGLSDLLAGAILLVVGIVGLAALGRNATLTSFDFGTDPGPALLPRVLLLFLLGGGAVLILLGVARLGPALAGLPEVGHSLALRAYIRPAAFAASLSVYLVALPRLGFIAATLLFGAGWIAVLTPGEDRGPALRFLAQSVAAALVITAALYYVFKGFVKVPLP